MAVWQSLADNQGQAVSIRFCSREGTALTEDSSQNKKMCESLITDIASVPEGYT